MKKLLIILLFACSLACCQNSNDIKFQTTAELVNILSSDSLEGRAPGTVGFEKAGRFVENYLRILDVKPLFDGSYRDNFAVYSTPSFNIVGVIESKESIDDYILIGAHLDHLGKIESRMDSVYNGANDNASGVAAVLQIARELKKYHFSKKIIIALFSGEESGNWGSNHLAQRLKKSNIKLSFVINIDMIGTPMSKSPGMVYITGFNKSNFAKVANVALNEGFVVFNISEIDQKLFSRSDNFPFYQVYHIPSHTLSTYDFENYPYMHTVEDEFSKLNFQNMDLVVKKLSKLFVRLLQKNSIIKIKN